MIEGYEITVIRTITVINPDDPSFNINRLINQKYTHIIKSTKKQTKKQTKKIKELEDRIKKPKTSVDNSNHSIKSKCLKWIVKKIRPDYKE